MIEISLANYNEMMRYEPAMDELRALALWIAQRGVDAPAGLSAAGNWQEDLFDFIKFYSQVFAQDILEESSIPDASVARFLNAIRTQKLVLGITEEDLIAAREQQIWTGCGFWEMRRYFGQFKDLAHEIISNTPPPDNLVTAGISGCVIGEYLGLLFEKYHHASIPIDHMVFGRDGILPRGGILPENFRPKGRNFLLVEDAVKEARTLSVMMKVISDQFGIINFSLFSLEIEVNDATKSILPKFSRIYLPED